MGVQVFIGHSHSANDLLWFKALRTHLAVLEANGGLIVCEQALLGGSATTASLAQAQVAVPLVSSDYLADAPAQLAAVLERFRANSLSLLWVPLSASLWDQTPLACIEPAHPKDRPLASLPTADLDQALVLICAKILAAVESAPSLNAPTGATRVSLGALPNQAFIAQVPLCLVQAFDAARFDYASLPYVSRDDIHRRLTRFLKGLALVYRGIALSAGDLTEPVALGRFPEEHLRQLFRHRVFVPFTPAGRSLLEELSCQLAVEDRGIHSGPMLFTSIPDAVQVAADWKALHDRAPTADPLTMIRTSFPPLQPILAHVELLDALFRTSNIPLGASPLQSARLKDYLNSFLETVGGVPGSHAWLSEFVDPAQIEEIMRRALENTPASRSDFIRVSRSVGLEHEALAALMDPIDRAWVIRHAVRCGAIPIQEPPLFQPQEAAIEIYLASSCYGASGAPTHLVFDPDAEAAAALDAVDWSAIFELRSTDEWRRSVWNVWRALAGTDPFLPPVEFVVSEHLDWVLARLKQALPMTTQALPRALLERPEIRDAEDGKASPFALLRRGLARFVTPRPAAAVELPRLPSARARPGPALMIRRFDRP